MTFKDKLTPMASGQGGILSAFLLFAILFRLGLLQEPINDGEYRRVNDLSFYACNASHISKFDYVLPGGKWTDHGYKGQVTPFQIVN